jgi:hypothetical protein
MKNFILPVENKNIEEIKILYHSDIVFNQNHLFYFCTELHDTEYEDILNNEIINLNKQKL